MKSPLLSVQAVVLLLRALDGRAVELINFAQYDEPTTVKDAEVVSGALKIYGRYDIELIGEFGVISRAAISKVCENALIHSTIFQDVMTFGKSVIGFNIDFHLLAPNGEARNCWTALATVGFGPPEPPFGDQAPPAFRMLFGMELEQNQVTKLMRMDEWRIELSNITCGVQAVIRPTMMQLPTSTMTGTTTLGAITTSSYPGCLDLTSEGWSPEESFGVPNFDCSFAHSACVCAALPHCVWKAAAGDVMRCRALAFGTGDVACEHCPLQAHCSASPAAMCAAQKTPCTCIASAADCKWDLSSFSCMPRIGDNTLLSCALCARQSFCQVLKLEAIEPEQLSVMGRPEVGWQINLTFNQKVKVAGSFAGNMYFECLKPYSNDQHRVRYDILVGQVVASNKRMTIDVGSVPNDQVRDCDLVIGDKALTDQDYRPFSGLPRGAYTITIGDLLPPKLVDFDPQNSRVGVPLDVVVVVTFDERVLRGTTAESLQVTALGGRLPNGAREADVVAASFSLDSPEVSFRGRSIVVDLSGIGLQHDKFYSVSLPPGFATDIGANVFAGLSVGIYAFRTVKETIEAENLAPLLDVESGAMPALIALAACTAAVILACTCLVLLLVVCKLYMQRESLTIVVHPGDKVMDVTEQAPHLQGVFSNPRAVDYSVATSPKGSPAAPSPLSTPGKDLRMASKGRGSPHSANATTVTFCLDDSPPGTRKGSKASCNSRTTTSSPGESLYSQQMWTRANTNLSLRNAASPRAGRPHISVAAVAVVAETDARARAWQDKGVPSANPPRQATEVLARCRSTP